jgi:HK97 family phage major capsid protein
MELNSVMEALKNQKGLIEDRFNGLSGRMSDLEKRTYSVEDRLKPRRVSLPGVNEEKDSFSFLRAINAIRSGDWSNAGFEHEVFNETAKRAGSVGTDSAGGYIVPSQFVFELIEMLRARAVVISMGATVLNDLYGSPLEIPKQTGGATAYWVSENSDITASDMAFGQLSMSPKSVAAMVKLSNRLLKLSNPSAEDMIRRDIVQSLALEIDRAALRGSGQGAEPKGIKNTVGINTVAIGTDGGPFTLDVAADMEGTVEDDNALLGSLGFVWHSKVKRQLKKQKIAQFSGDTAGEPVILPMSDRNLKDLIGYDFSTSNQIPINLTKGNGTDLSEVYFGNWQELIIAQWGGIEIMASSETSDAFQKNQTWVRVIQEVDIGLRHPESFCLCSDAETV